MERRLIWGLTFGLLASGCKPTTELTEAPAPTLLARTERSADTSRRTTIVLTYDDGMVSQLQRAVPQLDSLDLRATFFLNDLAWPEKIAGFRRVGASGHELGNHTLKHQCPRRMGFAGEQAAERYTPDRFTEELFRNDSLLFELDSLVGPRSFAHPCSYAYVDSPAVSTLPLLSASEVILAGRTGGTKDSVLLPDRIYPRFEIPSFAVPEGTDAQALIGFAEKAEETGVAGVYLFHGIDGEWIRVSADAHLALLEYLAANGDRFEVITFGELARRMKAEGRLAAVPR